MRIFLNELSLHRQFDSVEEFESAVGVVMKLRGMAQRFGREVRCSSALGNSMATPLLSVSAASRLLRPERRTALLAWVQKSGPFLEVDRLSNASDYVECFDGLVTDTSIAEAATAILRREEAALLGFYPSSQWCVNPLRVVKRNSETDFLEAEVQNFWLAPPFQTYLEGKHPEPRTWSKFEEFCKLCCPTLTFADDAFGDMQPMPFGHAVSTAILELMRHLEVLKNSFDENGDYTERGQELLTTLTTGGGNPLFSASSPSERIEFRDKLTFPKPGFPGETVFCHWHGKVRTSHIRIHFSYPIQHNAPLYVVYVGPKRTKR